MEKDRCIYAGCRRVIKVSLIVKLELCFDQPVIISSLYQVFDTLTHQISFEFELPTNDSIYSLTHSDTLLFAGALSGTIYVSLDD